MNITESKFIKSIDELKKIIIEILRCDQGKRKVNYEYSFIYDTVNIKFYYDNNKKIIIKSIISI